MNGESIPSISHEMVDAPRSAQRNPMRRQLLSACVLAPVLAAVGYILCPAVGPGWVKDPHAARNCMPSMHLTWALLFWWYSRGWVRKLMAFYVWVTVAATLGLGQHYWIDLIVAVPFTAAIVWIVRRMEDLWGLSSRKKSKSAETAAAAGQ